MQAFVDRFKAKASKARQAQSRLKMIEKLGPIVRRRSRSRSTFLPLARAARLADRDHRPGERRLPEGPLVLKKLDLRLDMDDRIALLGQNGNGKSTFIRLLRTLSRARQGEAHARSCASATSRRTRRRPRLRGTPFEHMNRRARARHAEHKVRAQLGRFGFSRERGDLKVGLMSGGEKTRCCWRSPRATRRTCCCSTSRPTISTWMRANRWSRRSTTSRAPSCW
jgi:ATP-binding cassette subfamily F protein 3